MGLLSEFEKALGGKSTGYGSRLNAMPSSLGYFHALPHGT